MDKRKKRNEKKLIEYLKKNKDKISVYTEPDRSNDNRLNDCSQADRKLFL